jgi:serine/threonine protein kinase
VAGEGPDSTKSNPGDGSRGDPTKEGTVTGATSAEGGRGHGRSPVRPIALTPGTVFGQRYRIVAPIGRLPLEKALDVARGLGAGLAALHARGILHRDLKPANVLIDGRGQARLSDFGLAISAEDGAGAGVSGTPVYMAPEPLAGAAATARSDLYAFGLVLYEVLAGKRPFEAGSLEGLRARHAAGTPPSLRSSVPEVDPRVERLVLQCLEKDPSARPPSHPGARKGPVASSSTRDCSRTAASATVLGRSGRAGVRPASLVWCSRCFRTSASRTTVSTRSRAASWASRCRTAGGTAGGRGAPPTARFTRP